MTNLLQTPAWRALNAHYNEIKDLHMRDLFSDDAQRFERFSCQMNDLLLDYSKNRINQTTLSLLMDLARQAGIEDWRDQMLAGEVINCTEHRSVLHTALRNRSTRPVMVAGQNVMPQVNAVLAHMRGFTDRVRSGE